MLQHFTHFFDTCVYIHIYNIYYIHIYSLGSRFRLETVWLDFLTGTGTLLPPHSCEERRQLAVLAIGALEIMTNVTWKSSLSRAYQVCSCKNWIWSDRIKEGSSCRKCGTAWPKPFGGFTSWAPMHRTHSRWTRSRSSPSPPPGLSQAKPLKPSKIQREAAQVLAPAWESQLGFELLIKSTTGVRERCCGSVEESSDGAQRPLTAAPQPPEQDRRNHKDLPGTFGRHEASSIQD